MDLMRTVSTVALAAGLSLVAGTAAQAETEAFVRAATLTVGSGTGPALTFDSFDPSLGTLTGVVFSLVNDDFATNAAVAGNFTSGEGGSASAKIRSEFHIFQIPGVGDLFKEIGGAESSCISLSGGCTNPVNDSGSEAAPTFPATVTFTDPADLEHFIDDGSSPTFGIFVVARALLTGSTCVGNFGGAATCVPTASVNWAGSLSVEFRFDPAPSEVPVPATLGLLGAGLAGLAAARRRRA